MKIRFGICGLGFAGSVLMAPAMNAHANAQIVAACDPNEELRTRFGAAYGIATYASLDAMLEAAALDAVYIASPHQFHCEQVLKVSAHRLHIIVEKPLTLNLEDAQRMVDAVQSAQVQLVVGTSRSHDPVIRTMRSIVQSGEVGRVAMVSCMNFTDWLYRPRRPEELDGSRGGGIIFNQLPHQIDCIKAITGQNIVAVRAVTGRLDPQRPVEGHCAALLTLDGGACATLTYSGYDHFDSDELQFWIGEGGRPKSPNHGNARKLLKELNRSSEAEFRRTRYGFAGALSKPAAAVNVERKQPHFGLIIASCEHADLRPSPNGVLVYGNGGVSEVPAMRGNGTYGQGDTIDELHDAISGRAPVLRDAQWGLETVKVCLAVQRSNASGEQVMLDRI
jgi:phthalate 4,5-cis-dihydrodiol dehydrogenase